MCSFYEKWHISRIGCDSDVAKYPNYKLRYNQLMMSLFQVSFEPDKWFDVPLEQNRQIECSFCLPANETCVVQVNSTSLYIFAALSVQSYHCCILDDYSCSSV